jgi:UDP-glucose 4-epimerase
LIDDVVNAVLLSLNREEGYDVFNVCTGVPTTVETVVGTICSAMDHDVTVEYSNSTPGDQFGIYGDYQKIKATLGWSPAYDFKHGMQKMIDWAVAETAAEN